EEDRVVAAVVGRLDVALQVGEGAVEQGGAGDRAGVPADGDELGHAAGPARVREVAGQVLLVGGQDRDGEAAGLLQHLVHQGVADHADQHQQRGEGDRGGGGG